MQTDIDMFSEQPFTYDEVGIAIKMLHLKKACGYDAISTEHMKYAGHTLIKVMTRIYNLIAEKEYIPVNFRRDLQIPLYKGKNTYTIDTNVY